MMIAMHGLLAFIGVVFAFLITIGMNKAHYERTGVRMPSRSAMRAIRRRGRKKGLNEWKAYEQWLARKQAKLAREGQPVSPPPASSAPTPQPEVSKAFPVERGTATSWLWIVPVGLSGVVLALLIAYLQSHGDAAIPVFPSASATANGPAAVMVPLPRARPARRRVGAPLDLRPPHLQ